MENTICRVSLRFDYLKEIGVKNVKRGREVDDAKHQPLINSNPKRNC